MNKLDMAAIYFAKNTQNNSRVFVVCKQFIRFLLQKMKKRQTAQKKVLEIEKFPTVSSFSATNNNQRDL